MGTTWDDICKSVDSWTKKTNRKMEKATEDGLKAALAELKTEFTVAG